MNEIISFLLLTLGFVVPFQVHLSAKLDCLFELFLVFRDRPIIIWISLLGLLSQCPTNFGLLCLYFHLFQGISWFFSLILLLTYSFFINTLLSFYVFAHFSVFFLWLISNFIALWSEKTLDITSIFLNLLRFVLCSNMWSILESVPCALEKSVYSAASGWDALKIPIKSIWSSVSFKAAVSLLIFLSGRSSYWSQWGVRIPDCDCIAVSLSLYVHQDSLHIRRCSHVGCVNVY